MNSEFEKAIKVASHIGAQQAYNRIRERSGLEKKAVGAGTLVGLLHGAATGPEDEKIESMGHGLARGLGFDMGMGLGGTAGTGIGTMLASGFRTPQSMLLRLLIPSLAGAGAGGYGGYKLMDKLMGETPREKKAFNLANKGVSNVSNAFSNVLKSKGGKAGLLGAGLVGTNAASAYGGAQYGKNKTIDTIKTNMDNQGFMDRLKTIFQYLMGNTGAVMNNLGFQDDKPTG